VKYQPAPVVSAGGAGAGYAQPMFVTQPPIEGGMDRALLNGFIRDRPAFSHVEIRLEHGQVVKANARTMIWMDGHVKVVTKCNDCCDGCWRQCAGESCCINYYTGPPGGGAVTFALDLPGDMLPFGVAAGPGNGWVVAAGDFVCGTENLVVTARFAGCQAWCCGDTKPWLCKVTLREDDKESRPGMFWAGGYGALTRHDVPAGKSLFLDNGLFFAANERVDIGLGLPGGCISCCFGGEGVVMQFKGPVVVYSQNRSPALWQRVLNPQPHKQKKKKRGGVTVGA